MGIEKYLINNNKDLEANLDNFIYLTNKVILYDNNISEEQLNYKYDLKDKFKFKYNLNTYELYYNIGLISRYLNENEKNESN